MSKTQVTIDWFDISEACKYRDSREDKSTFNKYYFKNNTKRCTKGCEDGCNGTMWQEGGRPPSRICTKDYCPLIRKG